jgi:hypothetical protein
VAWCFGWIEMIFFFCCLISCSRIHSIKKRTEYSSFYLYCIYIFFFNLCIEYLVMLTFLQKNAINLVHFHVHYKFVFNLTCFRFE